MNNEFSVLMSVYLKERTEYADACFQSLLSQTVVANEWVIVEDGPLTQEMYELLDSYQKDYPGLIHRVPLEKNQGLGAALQVGLLACRNELIARMDTDDIAREDRFAKQMELFKTDSELDICGSDIDEFEDNPNDVVAHRKVPAGHNEIVEYQKRRDAFNHVTVMFKKNAVLQAGNYQPCPLMEDTYLWVRMIQSGAKCRNINEPLVFVRIGKNMYERRGGIGYFLKYRAGRKKVYKTGYISYWDYFYTLLAQFVVAMLPARVRGNIYKKRLHRQ